jgi:hypothetical protein
MIIHHHVYCILFQIAFVLFDCIMFAKACFHGGKRNAGTWSMVLMVSLQAYCL